MERNNGSDERRRIFFGAFLTSSEMRFERVEAIISGNIDELKKLLNYKDSIENIVDSLSTPRIDNSDTLPRNPKAHNNPRFVQLPEEIRPDKRNTKN